MGNEIERAVQEDVYQLYGGYKPFTVALTHIVNQHAGIGWTTYSHTGVPVLTFAKGAGQDISAATMTTPTYSQSWPPP